MNSLACFNIHRSGRGRTPLIFSHGFGCDQSVWQQVAPAFADDFDVILYDLVGARPSNRASYDPIHYASLNAYANDLLCLMDGLQLEQAQFVGHSVSAAIGAHAAARAPHRFAGLSLVAPSPCYINDGAYRGGMDRAAVLALLDFLAANYFAWAQTLAPTIMGRPTWDGLTLELTDNFCRTDPDVARAFARVTFLSDWRSLLPAITVPTLIMQCRDDALAPPEVGHYMHQQIPGSVLALLEATGHCPHLSAPQETVAVLRRFLLH
ncbi:sigma-B regulation protein RsbQ [Noviherbaspirillum humi]|uniref:Sigma-B regulation protein RsbQ n=1 Tax=Noviherbaspirillum humi TaxID=1688639 RepID=A0A239BXP9_9BURK|nr:alpha/beta hydrolase [Noviherbaspirillum humi]SNS11943.1 sigma-B regulation protein RsbQ [Noviherbaspirillum humi]